MSEDERTERGKDGEILRAVCTVNGEMEALTLKSALEAAGIHAEIRIESATKLLPVTVDGLGAVRVMVPADRLEEAMAIAENPAAMLERGEEDDELHE